MKKAFDQALFDADNSAVDTLIEWLSGQGWSARMNPDIYGIDVLAVAPDGKDWEIEVEVKYGWVGQVFPYAEVHFSARKLKFCNPDSIFVMFNSDRSMALGVRGSVVAQCQIVEKTTRYTEIESFIAVPLSLCRVWKFV